MALRQSLSKSLLLIVDMQQGFMNDETCGTLPVVNQFAAAWQERGWPMLASRFVNLPGSNFECLRDWREMQSEPDTALADGLKIDTTFVMKKSTYAAWSSEVRSVCMIHGVRDVVIVGVDTNECVLATALAIFDDNFIPWVVEDACASSGGAECHRAAIQLLTPLIGAGQIVRSTDIL